MGKSTSLVFAFVLLGAAASQAQLVTGEVREGLISIFASQPVEAAGLDFQSAAGRLIPVPDPPGALPFTFFLSNTANQITWGNLGSTVTLDGAFDTQAGYAGDPDGDLQAFWGNGPGPVAIPISLVGEPLPLPEPPMEPTPVIPPPDTSEPPIVRPRPRPDPPIVTAPEPFNLPPSPRDGLVVGEVREETILLLTNEPVAVAGLFFVSQAGRIIPAPDNDASPFTFFLANTPNQVSFGNLGTSVTLNGELVLPIGYTGNPDGDLTAAWGDGPQPITLPITLSDQPLPEPSTPPIVEPPVVPANPDPPVDLPGPNIGTLTGVVNEDGFVVLTANEPIEAAGIDLQSAAGNLIPVSEEIGSLPFTFFLSNTPNQITWGNLGSTVTLDGDFVTGAGYNGDPEGDLLGFWGNGATPVAFAITAGTAAPVVPGNEVIPEPNAISLAWFAMVGLLGLRNRRRSRTH